MTKSRSHELECPRCGSKQETTVFESVNVTLDPELQKKLFDGNINTFNCSNCGEKVVIVTPLIYHDMAQKFCIHYYPPEQLDDTDFYKEFKSDGSLAISNILEQFPAIGPYLSNPHIVFDIDEMLRYIFFRDQLHRMDLVEKSIS